MDLNVPRESLCRTNALIMTSKRMFATGVKLDILSVLMEPNVFLILKEYRDVKNT